MKQALKIKLANHSEFKQAWDALIKLGYRCPEDLVPHTAPYLYAYADGILRADYFDVEGADLSSPKSALGYFNTEDNHKEVTLEELLGLAKQNGHEPFYDHIPLIKQERHLFEANYVKNGGDLQFLKWDECDDGAGDYQPDWEKIGLVDHKTSFDEHEFGEKIMQHAEHVRSCLMSWAECAKSKAIPDGYVLMPIEPTQNLIDQEMEGKVLPAVMGAYERAVDNFKNRYSKLIKTIHPQLLSKSTQ